MARLCLNLQPLTQQLVFVNRWNSAGSSCKEVFILVFFVCYWRALGEGRPGTGELVL